MDDDEKSMALKKAYADIILNMSKEAARRVMASEMKAVRYQNELKLTKDEALRMLMRLKQMMDSKMNETSAASLNQQKKIDELEAQLAEAEDIVRDLREELSTVHDELEKVKKDNSCLGNEAGSAFSRQVAIEKCTNSYPSNSSISPKSRDPSATASDAATMSYLSQTNECFKCYDKTVCTCSSFIGNEDLPSMTLSCKDSGLYRKGCTQRIHAREMHLLDRDLCLSGEADKVKDAKNERKQEEDGHICRVRASVAETLNEPENDQLEDVKGVNCFLQKRRRSNRKRKTVTPISGKQPDIFLKLDREPEFSANQDFIPIKHHLYSENPSKLISSMPPEKAESKTFLDCLEFSEKNDAILDEDRGLTEGMLPILEETGVSDGSQSLDCEMEGVKVDAPSKSSSDATEGIFNKPKGERVIKITFQRKRKRQAFEESGFSVPVETEKKNGNRVESSKSGLVMKRLRDNRTSSILESSRDSRRLAQVARQLISLSEKKWWD